MFKIRSHNHDRVPSNEYYVAYVLNYAKAGKQFIDSYKVMSAISNINSSPVIDLNSICPINVAAWPATKQGEFFAIQLNHQDDDLTY